MNTHPRSVPMEVAQRHSVLAALLGRVLHVAYRLFGRIRHDKIVLANVGDMPLLVLPSVFNPQRMRTGAYFASVLESGLSRDLDVLDMGTGSGVCSIAAARHARRVVAIDVNPAAVCCTRINALLNRLDSRIDVRHSDLYAGLNGERFDLILFNPPFLRGTPKDDFDRAWRATDVAERFAQGLREHLKDSGFALVLLSTFGDATHFLDPLNTAGFRCAPFATRRYFNETVTVFKVTPA